jgi:Protein of unknown function (DUF3237)
MHTRRTLLRTGTHAIIGAAFASLTLAEESKVTTEARAPTFEYVMTVVAKIDAPIAMGKTPQGDRRVVPISGGDFDGPNLKGAIMPGGEDWQLVRPDGVTELDARYWLKTDDGVIIRVRNRALAVPAPAGSGDRSAVRCAPEFDAPIGKYDWLNKGIFVGTLTVNTPPTGVTLRFYKVQ